MLAMPSSIFFLVVYDQIHIPLFSFMFNIDSRIFSAKNPIATAKNIINPFNKYSLKDFFLREGGDVLPFMQLV